MPLYSLRHSLTWHRTGIFAMAADRFQVNVKKCRPRSECGGLKYQSREASGMKPQVAVDKARDEEIGVVVALAAVEHQRDAGLGAGRLQQFGLELRAEEIFGGR